MFDQLLDEFERTEELMLNELRKINEKGDLTAQEICNIKEMAETIYKMQIVEAMIDDGTDYSEYYPDDSMRSTRRGRDMRTGRYMSRRGMRSYGSDHMMSGHSLHDRMIAALENTMDQAKTDYDRQQIKEWIHKIQMDENKQ